MDVQTAKSRFKGGPVEFPVTVNGKNGRATRTTLAIEPGSVSWLSYVIAIDLVQSVASADQRGGSVIALKYEGRPKPKRITFDDYESANEALRLIEAAMAMPPTDYNARQSILPPAEDEDDLYDVTAPTPHYLSGTCCTLNTLSWPNKPLGDAIPDLCLGTSQTLCCCFQSESASCVL